MKRTVYLLVLLSAITMPLYVAAGGEIYSVIEKSDTNKLRELFNSALFSVTKKDKKAFKDAAHQKVNELQMNISNFGPNEGSRLALGLSSTIGVTLPLFVLGMVFRNMVAIFEEVAGQLPQEVADLLDSRFKLISIPMLLGSGITGYWGIDNIIKAVKRSDNKTKYDKALAIEAMIRRIKAKTAN